MMYWTMIGKIKNFNYISLISLLSLAVLLVSYIEKNYSFFILFCLSIISSIFSVALGLKFLKKYKIFQRIKEEGPSSHFSKKEIPTMGGIFFLPFFLIYTSIIDIEPQSLKIILICTISGFLIIGLADDYLSIKNKTNLGLKGIEKLGFQILISSFFIISILQNNIINSEIMLTNNLYVDIKGFILPLSFITIIALSNSVNLTDGLDGLAAGCSSIVFCGLGIEILLKNTNNMIGFSLLSFSMAGLCLGFLVFNKNPAKIFMGDTGSLTIGAILGLFCIITNSYITTLICSGIFAVEALSVILQVSFFKFSKKFLNKEKRIFLMTPIHHHFELKGIKEKKIVGNFWLINIYLVIFSIVLKMSY